MHCPKCQTDVPEGHFYCPNCRASVYSDAPDRLWSGGSMLERAGKRLLDLLILLALIAGGVALARAIKWKELLDGFKPVAEASPTPKREREAQPGSLAKRRAASPSPTPQEKTDNSSKPASAESVREMPQKIEELPKPGESQSAKKPIPSPTPVKPLL